ncbi:MAG: UTP--glucose-1-phosphate uridylyltransferase [Candidatus Dependentiae bacterium]|nr:UTP--glucose-1-phosphate uridylyltransferase [Candidatus Dependentiae bacterium]
MHIHQAIIPAAGLGTRFLPFTKATPKELLPLLNKSAIEYIIKEGVDAGITDFYMITSGNKPTLAKYLQLAPELEAAIAGKKGEHLLSSISTLIRQARIEFINQDKPLGLGHAVLMAKQQIGDTYFGVLLPDDIIFNAKAALAQLIGIAQTYNATVIAVQEVEPDQVSSYGIVAIKKEIAPGLVELSGLVEKPAMHDAPSHLAIIGRYVLSPRIFNSLERTQAGSGGEIQLTDAIQHVLNSGERVLAYQVEGSRYDIGTPEGWLQANIELGLQVPEYTNAIKQMVKKF